MKSKNLLSILFTLTFLLPIGTVFADSVPNSVPNSVPLEGGKVGPGQTFSLRIPHLGGNYVRGVVDCDLEINGLKGIDLWIQEANPPLVMDRITVDGKEGFISRGGTYTLLYIPTASPTTLHVKIEVTTHEGNNVINFRDVDDMSEDTRIVIKNCFYSK